MRGRERVKKAEETYLTKNMKSFFRYMYIHNKNNFNNYGQ